MVGPKDFPKFDTAQQEPDFVDGTGKTMVSRHFAHLRPEIQPRTSPSPRTTAQSIHPSLGPNTLLWDCVDHRDTLGASDMQSLAESTLRRQSGVRQIPEFSRRVFRNQANRIGCCLMLAACAALATTASGQQTPDPSGASAPIVQPGAPGTPSKRLPDSTTGQTTARSGEDIEFMQGMIMHHGQAVEMTAWIPSHTENQAIRTLGARISRSQSDEMNFMKRWLVLRGQPISMSMPAMPGMDMKGDAMPPMPGMLTESQMEALDHARGAEFDRLFLTGMIQHHNGALIMVKQLFDTPGAGQDADIFDFATDADNTQRAEIRIMQGMLQDISKEKE